MRCIPATTLYGLSTLTYFVPQRLCLIVKTACLLWRCKNASECPKCKFCCVTSMLGMHGVNTCCHALPEATPCIQMSCNCVSYCFHHGMVRLTTLHKLRCSAFWWGACHVTEQVFQLSHTNAAGSLTFLVQFQSSHTTQIQTQKNKSKCYWTLRTGRSDRMCENISQLRYAAEQDQDQVILWVRIALQCIMP